MFQQLDGKLVYTAMSDQTPAPEYIQPIVPILDAAHKIIETEAVLELYFIESSNIR